MTHSKVFFVLLCTMFYATVTFSRNFEITSNANAGPGSLRAALFLAASNGSTEKDIIIFKLPITGRSIVLLSKLPAVSSNLIIDASTQEGPKFGVSDAKVKLVVNYNSTFDFAVLEIRKQHDVEIYGLGINKASSASANHHAIICESSKNVIIGGVGKGCLFGVLGLEVGKLMTAYPDDLQLLPQNIKISSNIFGLLEDGETLDQSRLNIGAVKNLTIGGDTPGEGNVFNGQIDYVDYVYTTLSTGTLTFANNKFGVNASGTKVISNKWDGTSIDVMAPNLELFIFKDNQVCGASILSISTMVNPFKITGNKFGTDPTGTLILGMDNYTISIAYCEQGGILGGSTPAEQNIFTGANRLGIPTDGTTTSAMISNVGTPNVELFNNIIKCNTNPKLYSLAVSNVPMSITEINLVSRSDEEISGTATANARVDLYYSLTCVGCEPEKLFASVNADKNGNWTYKGKLEPQKVIASATFKGQSSEFTSLQLNTSSNVKIKMVCGDTKGSIKGISVKNATNYGWYNGKGELISKTLDLLDVEPGTYQFIAKDDYCETKTKTFEIKRLDIISSLSELKNISAACGLKNGSITGIKSNGTSFVWTDEHNNEVGYELDLLNIAAGQYKLHVSSDYCEEIYGPFDVQSIGGITYPNEIPATISKACELNKSSISLNFGELKKPDQIEWQNETGQVIGAGATLSQIGAGTYTVYFITADGCKSLYKSYKIEALSVPVIDVSAMKTLNEICGNAGGSITNILVKNTQPSLKHIWRNQNGTQVGTSLNLNTIKAGIYTLEVIDDNGCASSTGPITIANDQLTPDAALADDVHVVAPGEAVIQVRNVKKGVYRLYEQEGASSFLQENDLGIFKVQVNSSKSYYITFSNGNCESIKTKVTVRLSTGELVLTNSFSPNNDGVNDKWVIKGIEHYPDCRVQIFNRYGTIVFQSEGYSIPFEGISPAGELPVGVYYYVITFNGRRTPLSGSLTLIR